MGLDIALYKYLKDDESLFSTNITHNLANMANRVGIYEALWSPNEINAKYAKDIINIIEKGLNKLKYEPEYYNKFSASNGWGTYNQFIPFLEGYLCALKKYPDAIIYVNG